MSKIQALLAFAVAAGAAALAPASEYRLPLPSLTGAYVAGATRTVDFDVGVDFTRIDHVRVHWSGTFTAGWGHGDGLCRPADEVFPWAGEFFAELLPRQTSGLWYASESGPSEHGTFPFDSDQAFQDLFNPTWDFLLDGQAGIQITFQPKIALCARLVSPPSAELSELELIIVGEAAYRAGDLNCDAVHDSFDIHPFVLVVTGKLDEYAEEYSGCDAMLADCDGSGEVDVFDIAAFVNLLTGG